MTSRDPDDQCQAQCEAWMRQLEERHLADLTFPEVSRALRALSSAYVERRQRLHEGIALSSAGKRAAFALYYGPLHFLFVRAVVTALDAGQPQGTVKPPAELLDIGCGTGAAGAAWATRLRPAPRVTGVDVHPWVLQEAAKTYRAFGLHATTRRGDAGRLVLPDAPTAFLAAYTLNEMESAARDTLLARLLARTNVGDRVLIVEPLAGAVAPWWNRWRDAFVAAGGRADEWRFQLELPAIVRKLDAATRLDHRQLVGKSLWFVRAPADPESGLRDEA